MTRFIKRKGIQKAKHAKGKKKKGEALDSLFLWFGSADNFISKLKEFGYIGDDDGVCHGIVCVAAHAMLLEQIDQFDQDLLLIKHSRVGDAPQQPVQRAFLESVELCHHPGKYAWLFGSTRERVVFPNQDPLLSLGLIQSAEIANQGGLFVCAKFSGVYSLSELAAFFAHIRVVLEKFSHPVAIMLSDEGHIITVQYDVKKGLWHFVDLKSLPSKKFFCEKQLAHAVAGTLTADLKKTVMSSVFLVTKKYGAESKKHFVYMARLKSWKKLHEFDDVKKAYFKLWLLIAASDGCEKEVALLLANQVNPNCLIPGGVSPLAGAARNGNKKIVRMLLEHGARADERRRNFDSSLFSAIRGGHDKVAALLEGYGAQLKSEEYEMLSLPQD